MHTVFRAAKYQYNVTTHASVTTGHYASEWWFPREGCL